MVPERGPPKLRIEIVSGDSTRPAHASMTHSITVLGNPLGRGRLPLDFGPSVTRDNPGEGASTSQRRVMRGPIELDCQPR